MVKLIHALSPFRYALIALVVAGLLIVGQSIFSTHADLFAQPSPSGLYTVALTFDDGPHPYFTHAILAELKTGGATATFFVVGSQAQKNPDLVRAIAANGCEVESHTMTHRNLLHLTDNDIRKELQGSVSLINSLSGRNPLFFRPPGGQYNDRVVKVAGEMGLTMVLWTVIPRDHEENDVDAIVDRVVAQTRDGGIILLHSGRHPTLAALPRIIAELHARGFRFVTIENLMTAKGAA
ncbi:MAG: polysaccharide deacetylase family protein [Elusimicrobia bacterium]|nr:polysaccharide deacetylase family protein [Elusimicrobiota bacterium]